MEKKNGGSRHMWKCGVWLQEDAENKGLPQKYPRPVNIEAAETDKQSLTTLPEETEKPGEQTGCSTEVSKVYSQGQAGVPPTTGN